MEGGISLKKFILGVKRELQEASAEGSENPFLELTQVELEAEFSLETSGEVEGGFLVFVKASAGAGASQSHKVKLIFSPISVNDTITYGVSPSFPTDQPIDPISGTSPQKNSGPTFITPLVVGRNKRPTRRPGIYFQMPQPVVFDPEMDIEEIVKKAMLKINEPNKKGGGSEEGGE